jgi:hypothetical protein
MLHNRSVVPTCYHQPNHDSQCTSGVKQYPWHDLNGFGIEKCEDQSIPLYIYFNRTTNELCLKRLANRKALGPNQIPNNIFNNKPSIFYNLLFLFILHCYKQQQIPASWKHSLTILLYKKGDPTQLNDCRLIALANNIY